MSSIKEPPAFFDDPSGYAEYKHNLLRWARLTKVDKKQRAEVVLYHLRGHSSGIQEKIDTALGDAVEDKEDGLQKLVEYLDTIYAEDEMTSAWTKYKQFVRLKKDHAQPVNEFIADFEKASVEAREGGYALRDMQYALCIPAQRRYSCQHCGVKFHKRVHLEKHEASIVGLNSINVSIWRNTKQALWG